MDFEIVGLRASTNGRSCTKHACCGMHVKCNDLVKVKKTVATVNGKIEEAGQVVLVKNGDESCVIAFVPKIILKNDNLETILGSYAQITELYKDSKNTYKQSKDHNGCGMASCRLLNSINNYK